MPPILNFCFVQVLHNDAELAHSILSTDHEGEAKLTENDVMNLFEKF